MSKRYVRWLLVILWALVIFLFSSQIGEESGNNNRFIIHMFSRIGINLEFIFKGSANIIIRKLGHFTEFFILYLLIFNALIVDFKYNKTIWITLMLVFIYACLDEIHQMFVPGRYAAIGDVLIDTGGGVLCMLIKNISKKWFKGKKAILKRIR